MAIKILITAMVKEANKYRNKTVQRKALYKYIINFRKDQNEQNK